MRAVVIGVGNPARRDDGIGAAVVQRLRHDLIDDVAGGLDVVLLELDGEPARVTEAWTGAELAVVIDAAYRGDTAGSIVRLDVSRHKLPPSTPAASSHGLGVAEAVELGGALGRLPGRLVVFGVEPESVDVGFELTPAVEAAVKPVAALVRSELSGATTTSVEGERSRSPDG